MSKIECKVIPQGVIEDFLSKYKDKKYVTERFIRAKLGVFIKDTMPSQKELDDYMAKQIEDIDSRFKDARVVPFKYGGEEKKFLIMQNTSGEYIITDEEGNEVFKKGNPERDFILMNYKISKGEAWIVEYNNQKYVIDDKGTIIDVYTRKKIFLRDFTDDQISEFSEKLNEAIAKKSKKTVQPNSFSPIENAEESQDKEGYKIKYTPKGEIQQEYIVKGTKIYNTEGREVFAEEGPDRNKILFNLDVLLNKAVVVEYKNKNYIVNTRGDIIDAETGQRLEDKTEEKETILSNTPTYFTFNDGIKVDASFKPNKQQEEALNTISDFIKSDATTMTLSGYAGTGKTSLMQMVADKCTQDGVNIVFSASTNKAAAVLSEKVKKTGFKAITLNKAFGIMVELDSSKEDYNVKNLVNKLDLSNLAKNGIYPGTVVVIDEASMINTNNYNTINQIAKDFNLKIIYVGDSAQLNPVKENNISKVFTNNNGKVVTLTQVERTGDNAILKEATALRNNKGLSEESSFNKEGKGVAYIKSNNHDSIKKIIQHFATKIKDNPNYFRILAYTNKMVAYYNDLTRSVLGYKTMIPRVGEPMMGYTNMGYDWRTGSYALVNSEAYTVTDVKEQKSISVQLSDTTVEFSAVPITLINSSKKANTFNFIDIKTNQKNKLAAITVAEEKKKLWKKWRENRGNKKLANAILAKIQYLDSFLFVNDDIIDDKGNTLQNKVIDYGYAMTVHKSQGSTFDNVLIDDDDIAKVQNTSELDEWSDFLGKGIENTILKQLEYVAVSRATDTVSIISKNTKKEGTPLQPETAQSSKTEGYKLPFNPKEATFYSGGAKGADTYWGEVANKAGIKVVHYTTSDWDNLPKELKEKFEKEYLEVVKILGRKVLNENTYVGKLVRRSMMQADDADAIFAISTLDNDGFVKGGTAYAVIRGIQRGIPVYLFDQNSNSWKIWDDGNFKEIPQPTITKNAAVIGSRELQDNGKKAIDAILSGSKGRENIIAIANKIFEGKKNKKEQQENNNKDYQFVTVAPYFRSKLTSSNKEEMIQATKDIQEKANKLAKKLGLEIVKVEPLGGTYLGSSEISWFYTLKNADQEKIDLFASLMGDLSNEYQDAVIAANYVNTEEEATALEVVFTTPEGTTIEQIEKTLQEVGIDGSSFHFDTNELAITCFSQEEVDNIFNKLKDKYEYKGYSFQNSRYLDNESRRNLYKTWLKTKSNTQDRSLYNACSKALAICEAAARYPEEVKETERFEATKQAAEQWDKDNLKKQSVQTEDKKTTTPLLGREGIGTTFDPKPTVEEQKRIDKIKEKERVTSKNLNNVFGSAAAKLNRVNLIVLKIEEVLDYYIEDLKADAESKGKKYKKTKKYLLTKYTDVLLREFKDVFLRPDQSFRKDKYTEEDWQYIEGEFKKIYDNFEQLFAEAANLLYKREDVKIDIVSQEDAKIGEFTDEDYDYIMNHETSEKTEKEEDNNIEDNDTETETVEAEEVNEEEKQDIKQGFSVKIREVDPRTTLSATSRRVLSNLHKVDLNGKKITDDLGFAQYEDADRVHTVLLEVVSKLNSPEEFLPAIQKLGIKYGWAKELYKMIQDDIMKESMSRDLSHVANIDAALYTDLYSEYLNYWIQIENKTKRVNKSNAEEYLVKEWARVYSTGTAYSKYPVYNSNQTFNLQNIKRAEALLNSINEKVIVPYLSDEQRIQIYKDNILGIVELLRMIGVNTTKEELLASTDYISENSEEGEKEKNTLQAFVTIKSSISTILDSLYNKNLDKEGKSTLLPQGTNIFTDIKFQPGNDNNRRWRELAQVIGVIPENVSMASFTEDGKSRYAYTKPSFWGRLLNAVYTLNYDQFKDYLQENFGKYKQFKDKNGYKNEFLRLLDTDSSFKKTLQRKVLLSKDKKEIEEMNAAEYFAACYAEYSNNDNKKGEIWMPMFILSDSSSYEFYKVPHMRRDKVLEDLVDLCMQEWERINLVLAREKNDMAPIANFDGKRGKQFCYFEFLNNPETFNAIVKAGSETERREIIEEELKDGLNREFNTFASKYVKDATEEKLKDLQDYYLNYTFWNSQMMQLLMVDPAYFKSITDFFKRCKGVISATKRLYTPAMERRAQLESRNFNRKKRRFISLSDIQYKSKILTEVDAIFKKAVKEGRMNKQEYDFMISNWKSNVNVTDGQGFVTLTSLKDTLLGLGLWNDTMQEAYMHIKTGRFTFNDIQTMVTVLKPYVFTNIDVESGVTNSEGENYGKLKVPMIIKNSEAVMMAIYQEIAGELGNSPFLKALNRFCEKENVELAQFSSGIKIGNIAPIDLNQAIEENWSEEQILDYLEEVSKIPNVIKEHNREDWGLITETPEHARDALSIIGSQAKKITTANIPDSFSFTYKHNGKEIKIGKKPFVNLVQFMLTAGYIKGFEGIQKICRDNISLSTFLLSQMAGSDQYTDDDRYAVSLNEDGEFNVPLTEPANRNRIEKLLSSIVSKKVTRQQMAGASCVQISAVGKTDDLSIRFKDKDGKLLPTKKQWLKNNKDKTEKDWENYINSIEGLSVAYYECYMPVYAKKFFRKYFKDGKVDVNKLPKELRKVVGYRIPTEAAYSMQPIYIKDFLPATMGSSIMLPAEITKIVGSDFDIDKVFMLLPEVKYDKETKKLVADTVNLEDYINEDGSIDYAKIYKETTQTQRNTLLKDLIFEFLTNKDTADLNLRVGNFSDYVREATIADIMDNMSIPQILEYYNIKQEDITDTKEIKKIVAKFYNEINNMSSSELRKLKEQALSRNQSLVSFNTQLFTFEQFNLGDKMIGINAVAAAGHNIGELTTTKTKKPFTFLGYTISKIDDIYDKEGTLISSNIAEGIGASVDNASNPTLYSLGHNPNTGNVTNFLLRAGIPLKVVLKYVKAMSTLEKNSEYKKLEISDDERKSLYRAINSVKLEDIIILSKMVETPGYLEIDSNASLAKTIHVLNEVIQSYGGTLNSYTLAARGDAQSNEAGPTLGQTVATLLKLKNSLDSADKKGNIVTNMVNIDSMLEQNPNSIDDLIKEIMEQPIPFVYAATKCGLVMGNNQLLKHVKIKAVLQNALDLLAETDITYTSTDELAKFIDQYINDYYLFLLRGTPSFSYDYIELLQKVPNVLAEMQEKYPEEFRTNALLNNIKVYIYNNSVIGQRIGFSKDYGVNRTQIENIKDAWYKLLTSNNKDLHRLGVSLLLYATTYGFNYLPNSLMPYISAIVKSKVEEYSATMNKDLNAQQNEALVSSFNKQFMANHLYDNFLFSVIGKKKNDVTLIDGYKTITATFEEGQSKTYVKLKAPAFEIGETVTVYYKKVSEEKKGDKVVCTYERIQKMGDSKLREYYCQEVVEKTIRDTLLQDNNSNTNEQAVSQEESENGEFIGDASTSDIEKLADETNDVNDNESDDFVMEGDNPIIDMLLSSADKVSARENQENTVLDENGEFVEMC